MWNHYETDEVRTSNHAEGFHSGFRNRLPESHASLQRTLRELQFMYYDLALRRVQLRSQVNPIQPKRRKQKNINVDLRLADLKATLDQVIPNGQPVGPNNEAFMLNWLSQVGQTIGAITFIGEQLN